MLKIRSLMIALTLIMSSALSAEPTQLVTSTGTLHGTIELPEKLNTPCPVALIIAGSGPTDRDGNNPFLGGSNNSLKMLAQGLAAQGIGSLRYDKRGIAQSADAMLAEEDLRFDTLAEDAALWVAQLKQDPRFSSVSVIGHSEGASIGLLAAGRAQVQTYVSIAGPGQPAGDMILSQIRSQIPEDLMKKCQEIVAALTDGQTVDDVPPALGALFRPSVQPYVISWFRYNPTTEIANFPGRILIAQGTSDIQVTVDDAQALAKAQPRAELALIEGMNHVLKTTPAEREKQLASYSDPSLPINQDLLDAVARFINK